MATDDTADVISIRDDVFDRALVATRLPTTGPERHTLDDVLARFGYTREQLAALPEDEDRCRSEPS